MKNIILFFYSIEFGEKLHPFAINEINSLREKFNQVHLVCLDARCGYEQIEALDGVYIHTLQRDERYTSIFTMLRAMRRIEVKDEIRIAKKNQQFSKSYLKELLKTIIPGQLMFSIAKRIIEKYHSDDGWIVESYWLDCSAYAAALLKEVNLNILCVSRAHGIEIDPIRNKYTSYEMKKYICKKLDYICFISDYGKNIFTQTTYKLYDLKQQDKLQVFRLGVNKHYSAISLPSKDGILRIVTCSRVVPVKRLDLLANALKLIEGFKIIWTHFGEGELLADLLDIVNDLPDNIEFRKMGNCENNEIHNYYSNSIIDVFINISFSEGIPVSIMEACAYSIPIIATNVGGTSEIVNEENGFLIDSNITPKDLATTIENYYNLDDSVKNRMRNASYKTWHDDFSETINQSQFIDFLYNK